MLKATEVLRIYFYLTPAFFILDSVWEQTFRVAGLDNPSLRYAYYGLCIICAVFCYLNHKLSIPLTLIESAVNMFILLASVMVPIYTAGLDLENNINQVGLTIQKLINFLLMGSLIVYSFHAAQSELRFGGE